MDTLCWSFQTCVIFVARQQQKKILIVASIINNLAKVELLYITGLYHDNSKGRGGDHSILGAIDAIAFCELRHLTEPIAFRMSVLADSSTR